MKVDIAALRAIERDKEIPFETVLSAIETALLTAYKQNGGEHPKARVEVDRKSGEVSVLVPETGEDGETLGEYDDTPEGFGRIAAATAAPGRRPAAARRRARADVRRVLRQGGRGRRRRRPA